MVASQEIHFILQSHKVFISPFVYTCFSLIVYLHRDGFSTAALNAKCNIPGTLVIIQSTTGHLFGGYTSVLWERDGTYKEDPTAFLFTLTNPHSIPPTKYSIDPQKKQFAIACKEGIAFGNGSDIYIANNSNYSRSSSYTNFPYTYVDSTGKRNNTFTGQFNFTAQEIEVYSVVDI